jgi:hypothetical protein
MIISPFRHDMGELEMRYTTKVGMNAGEIIELAEKDFSKSGLNVTDRTGSRICLENETGFVTLQVKVMTSGELDIITEGYDDKVKQFLKTLE